ncbi:MAG: hypothetical protein WCT16_01980 [Candidatus Buchananbacteria bacterium]
MLYTLIVGIIIGIIIIVHFEGMVLTSALLEVSEVGEKISKKSADIITLFWEPALFMIFLIGVAVYILERQYEKLQTMEYCDGESTKLSKFEESWKYRLIEKYNWY